MGDALALPQLMLGIPIGDCNVHTPDPDHGVPEPPWDIGAQVAGHISGLSIQHPSGISTSANLLGTGRSLYMPLIAGYDGPPADLGGSGAGQCYLQTPPTWYGWVPRMGEASNAFRPFVLLICRGSMVSGQSVYIALRQFNAAGAEVGEHGLGTINSANLPAAWSSLLIDRGSDVPIPITTRYFALQMWFLSPVTSGSFQLDFYAPGWTPGLTSMAAFDEAYCVGSKTEYEIGLSEIRPAFGGSVYPAAMNRGQKLLRNLTMTFDRAPQSWRDKLLYFWHAQNGTQGRDGIVGEANRQDLQGRQWPLLLRPNRPGIKQALYWRMTAPPLEIDEQLGYIEAATYFSGAVAGEEVDF